MSLKKNLFFQTLYQVIALCIPLILSPYLSRVLGAEAIGVYTFSYSIAYYFILLSNLGIQKYGIRLIAQNKTNKDELRKAFWSLYFVHSIFSAFSIGAFSIFSFFQKDDRVIYFIQIVLVASALTDITWMFYGLEDFLAVIIRNLVIKVLEITFIFIFVKKPEDLWIYTMIMAVSIFVSNSLMLPSALKKVPFMKFQIKESFVHLKPLFVLFLSTIAISIYTMVDKTILGAIDSKEAVAFYEYSDKLVRVPLQITTIVGTVLLPRMSSLLAQKDTKSIEQNMCKSIFVLAFMTCAFAFGLGSVSKDFIPLYYGDEFSICAELIPILSMIIIIIGVGDVFRSQYLVPSGKDTLFLISIVASAVINLILDFSLIPFYGVYGAIVATVITEGIGFVLQMLFTLKEYRIGKTLLLSIPFVLIGILMFVIVRTISYFIDNIIISLTVSIVAGATFYLLSSFLYTLLVNRPILQLITKRKAKGTDINGNCSETITTQSEKLSER